MIGKVTENTLITQPKKSELKDKINEMKSRDEIWSVNKKR